MRPYTVIKRDAFGAEALTYEGILRQRAAAFVCIDASFALADRDLGYITLRRGDRFREWFYRERWYNIFRVGHAKSGALKGWYCNITRPPLIETDRVTAEDLCLDVFVYPDGRTLLLDEDEFAALALPRSDAENAWRAVDAIRCLVEKRQPPFDEIPA